ncbi:D-alanyl-D-alanine carboxypeptidase family protein [Desulfosporosinus hippei]|uniref:D-alanyl-D-alanine carboxypeptidase (Penicillin-binding protein 5/6) n=1 Tax=Desulfosporosinus hippei DSM 8344 TaxID=1121419 RepID=A0A1G7ZVD5_9FIRM|nr:serine hydrolase [Desulfosporosinus hippei]SDH12638.1 D-alanyl-D-alanine carboxypeptidase (penicillin-binding protein 5/6) [Desulfosporosinus hippei DSM 8344]
MKKLDYRVSNSRTKRKTRRATLIIFSMLLSVFLLMGLSYFSPAIANLQTAGLMTDAKVQSSEPSKTGSSSQDLSTEDESYVLIDPLTGKVIKSHNADIQRAPASTLKLITGLVALKSLKESDIVRVGTEVNVEGSHLGLQPGDEISVHNLLTALYVNSSNDAAAALAVKVSGSIPAFAQEINEYAATLGCQNTHFTTPHGLPDPDQYTTANDLSKVAVRFIENKELMKFVKLTNAHVQWTDGQGKLREADLQNTNRLLGIYPGNQGLKTGTTTEAGQCLVSYVTRSDGDYLVVLLGSKQRYRDTILLLDEAWSEQRTAAALKGLTKELNSLILSPGIF